MYAVCIDTSLPRTAMAMTVERKKTRNACTLPVTFSGYWLTEIALLIRHGQVSNLSAATFGTAKHCNSAKISSQFAYTILLINIRPY